MTDNDREELEAALNGQLIDEVKVWPQIIEIRMNNGQIVEIMWIDHPDDAFAIRVRHP